MDSFVIPVAAVVSVNADVNTGLTTIQIKGCLFDLFVKSTPPSNASQQLTPPCNTSYQSPQVVPARSGRPRKTLVAKREVDQLLINRSLTSLEKEGYNASRTLVGKYKCNLCPSNKKVERRQRVTMVHHIEREHADILAPPEKKTKTSRKSTTHQRHGPYCTRCCEEEAEEGEEELNFRYCDE